MPISATFEDMLITEPPPDRMIAGMPKRQPRNVPNRSSLMTRQNSSSGACGHVAVALRRAAGVVVQHMQRAVVLHRLCRSLPGCCRGR